MPREITVRLVAKQRPVSKCCQLIRCRDFSRATRTQVGASEAMAAAQTLKLGLSLGTKPTKIAFCRADLLKLGLG